LGLLYFSSPPLPIWPCLAASPFAALERAASVLIMVSPFLRSAAFFIDPARGLRSSNIVRLAMYSLWIAGVLLAILNRPRRGEHLPDGC
jgi:hypothetical protein